MLYSYIAVITKSDGIYYAKVPDIDGCVTMGKTLPDVIAQITDALNLCLVVLEDEGIKPGAPTCQCDILHGSDDILTVVQVDTIEYRSCTDTRAIGKNVSPACEAVQPRG